MKKGMRVAFVLILASMLVLAACGNNGGTSGNADSSPGASGGEQQNVTLSFLSWYNEESMKPILDAFQAKYPHIKIDFQFVPPVFDYVEKLKVLAIANEAPDLFYLSAENRYEMINNGYAMDITDQPFFSELSPSNKEVYTVDGKIYAFAPDAWAGGFIYNKDLFDDVGAAPPNNWAEFLDVLGKLQGNGVRPIIERSDWLWTSLNSLVMNDVVGANPDYDKQVLSGEKTYADGWTAPIEQWHRDMIQSGYLTKDLLGVGGQQFFNEFATGKAGMLAGHLGHLKEVKNINPDINAGVFPMVGNQEGTEYLYGGVNVGVAVNANTKHPEEAKLFLNFLASDEGLKLYQQMTGFLLGIPGVDYEIDPVFDEIRTMYETGAANLYLPQFAFGEHSSSLLNELKKGVQDVLSGVVSPADVPASMDKKLQELTR
ncbi:ABC transporter substrate-binding protein [Paenibacillaceae bacterium WGS1546]|uniref:ABC transporter substrate-binding protein n=1 Tax=Cohnella sp. WGS1546 TaxID=3366810 RepID=UPI00372D4252